MRHSLTHSLTHSLMLCALLGGVQAQSTGSSRAPVDAPLAGSHVGTERWIVWLRDRGFDLHAQLQAARAGASAADRQRILDGIRQLATADQSAIAQVVQAGGGFIQQHYWVLSAVAVEIPPAMVRTLQAHPRVRRMVPVRARADSSFTPPRGEMLLPGMMCPQLIAEDTNNHNVAAARTIINNARAGNPNIPAGADRGRGARIAVLDTGIDENSSANTAGSTTPFSHHAAFLDLPLVPTMTRVMPHMRAAAYSRNPNPPPGDAIDCNNIELVGGIGTAGPSTNDVIVYRACRHSGSAFHGTAMAAIAAGSAHSVPSAQHPDGHAPEARLVDMAVSVVPTWAGNRGDHLRWTTNDATMLSAVELLRWFILSSIEPIHVANLSFDGWSDPNDPVSVAIDNMIAEDDVLVVTSAGNEADDTRESNGFYNGLAVGAVHARANATENFEAMGTSAHGPLASDPRRFFPDVCATGAGPGLVGGPDRYRYAIDRTSTNNRLSYLVLPRIDSQDPCAMAGSSATFDQYGNITACVPASFPANCSSATGIVPEGTPQPSDVHLGAGTSEASAQVAGAATLYRAVRPSATAQEAKAAILLNVLSPYPGSYPVGANPPAGTGQDQDTYHNRNLYGVGYVRDDFLAEFAVRDPAIKPLSSVVSLTGATAQASIPLPTLTGGTRYVVACCWPIRHDVEGDTLVDVDLEVREVGNPGHVLARSLSRANSYERAGFVVPTPAVSYEVHVAVAPGAEIPSALPVTVVGREFEPDYDPGTTGVQFTPMQAATGAVDSLPAATSGVDCAGPSFLQAPIRVIPSVYARAWGSGPLTMPFRNNATGGYVYLPPGGAGLDINVPRVRSGGLDDGYNLHTEIRADVIDYFGGPIAITGLAFRTWRPFSCNGDLTSVSVYMRMTPSSSVTSASLNAIPFGTATQVANGATLQAPLPSSGGSGVISYSADSFDSFSAVIPFTTPFTYQPGNNLHIWIVLPTTASNGVFEVDYAADFDSSGNPDPRYGCRYGTPQGGLGSAPVTAVGACPIMQLLMFASQANARPALTIFGEPLVGQGVELQGQSFPPNTTAWLFQGDWAPNSGIFGSCLAHVGNPNPPLTAPVDAFGRVRWGDLAIPLVPSLLSQVVGLQCVVPSTGVFSNALRVSIGGGL